MKSNNNKPNKNIDHKEGQDDDIDHVEDEHDWSMVKSWAYILLERVDRCVEDLRPAFKCLYYKQGEDATANVVVMKRIALPFTLNNYWSETINFF